MFKNPLGDSDPVVHSAGGSPKTYSPKHAGHGHPDYPYKTGTNPNGSPVTEPPATTQPFQRCNVGANGTPLTPPTTVISTICVRRRNLVIFARFFWMIFGQIPSKNYQNEVVGHKLLKSAVQPHRHQRIPEKLILLNIMTTGIPVILIKLPKAAKSEEGEVQQKWRMISVPKKWANGVFLKIWRHNFKRCSTLN